MAFFVYLFVLVVAAGSILFGLDLTQSPLQPPSYATATTGQPAASTPPMSRPATTATLAKTGAAPAPATTTAARSAAVATAHAQATPDEAQSPVAAKPAAVAAPAHCAIDACAAAYRSFRASDCTYQPFGGERRLCTKSASTKTIAARTIAHHVSRPADVRRSYDRRYAERDSYRDSYDEPRRGWAYDLFGGAFGR